MCGTRRKLTKYVKFCTTNMKQNKTGIPCRLWSKFLSRARFKFSFVLDKVRIISYKLNPKPPIDNKPYARYQIINTLTSYAKSLKILSDETMRACSNFFDFFSFKMFIDARNKTVCPFFLSIPASFFCLCQYIFLWPFRILLRLYSYPSVPAKSTANKALAYTVIKDAID